MCRLPTASFCRERTDGCRVSRRSLVRSSAASIVRWRRTARCVSWQRLRWAFYREPVPVYAQSEDDAAEVAAPFPDLVCFRRRRVRAFDGRRASRSSMWWRLNLTRCECATAWILAPAMETSSVPERSGSMSSTGRTCAILTRSCAAPCTRRVTASPLCPRCRKQSRPRSRRPQTIRELMEAANPRGEGETQVIAALSSASGISPLGRSSVAKASTRCRKWRSGPSRLSQHDFVRAFAVGRSRGNETLTAPPAHANL